MKNAHIKYLVGGIVIVGGIVGGMIAGMRKNEAEAAPASPPPKPPPAPAPSKPASFYPSEAERQKRLDAATSAVQSGDQATIQKAMAGLSPEDRAKLQSMLPKFP